MAVIDTVADWVLKFLPHAEADVAVLRQKRPGELLTLLFNWQGRLIAPQPRKIMRSVEFDRNLITTERSDVIAKLIDDIEHGIDLTKYLSRRVLIGFNPPSNSRKKNLRRRQHLDLLLNEWGIYHLHLSTNVESDGFVERDDPLLFAMFRADRAYLLNIGSHKSFEDEHLARVAVTNWPDDQLFRELKGICPPRSGYSYTPEERKQLRSAGLFSFIQIDGRVFSPVGGISTAGTTPQAAIRANRIVRALQNFDEWLERDPAAVIDLIKQNGGEPGENPEFEFAILPTGIGAFEKNSRGFINLSQGAAL